MSKPAVALVAGSTGAVGKHVVTQLLENPEIDQVYAFVRRENAFPEHPKLKEIQLTGDNTVDFTKIPAETDVVFDCVGTTIKKAGSKEAFRAVDFDFNTQLAQAARNLNVPQFHLVSSVGADKSSSFFYLRVKGEVEEFIQNLDFPIARVYQPGFLDKADRPEFRFGEWLGGGILRGLSAITRWGSIGTSAPIDVRNVAACMIHNYLDIKKADNLSEQNKYEVYKGSTVIDNIVRKARGQKLL